MYPLRLLVEAKCYQKKSQVEIGIVRNSVGVFKDIDENFFSYRLEGDSQDDSAKGPVCQPAPIHSLFGIT